MKTVALLTSSAAVAQEDFKSMHDREMRALTSALQSVGREVCLVRWDNPIVDWSKFESVIITSVWDYQTHLSEFLAVLQSIDQRSRLMNDIKTVRWNINKRYLLDLEAATVPIIPTVFADYLREADVRKCFDAFVVDTLVVKPEVGASGRGQFLLMRESAFPAMEIESSKQSWLVEPFQNSIISEGELSLVYIGGRFSHALRKRARAGEYRVQSEHGGRDESAIPSREAFDVAEKAVSLVVPTPLYARVDLVRLNSGELAVMEFELTEPYLYPEYGGDTFIRLFGEEYLIRL